LLFFTLGESHSGGEPVSHPWYHELEGDERRRESTAYFVLDSLLRSRIECGFESNSTVYDEDVNVYLVHLLATLITARDLGALTASTDHDIFRKVRDATSPRYKCDVYRANADQLLVSASIFTDTPYVEENGKRVFERAARDCIGRGKAYYHYASRYHEQVRAGSSTLVAILARLSADFERYVDVLFHMRGEYFNLFQRLRDDQLHRLQLASVETPPATLPAEVSLPELHDEFLDAYWAWQLQPAPARRAALRTAVERLRSADPDFTFELPDG
jgi:hypothetical protein